MPETRSTSTKQDETPRSEVTEFVDLTKQYVLQETVGPLKSIGRNLAYGSAAAFMFSFSGVFALVGLLRVLQTETGTTFTGHLSWVPYVIIMGVGLALVALAGLLLLRTVQTTGTTRSEAA